MQRFSHILQSAVPLWQNDPTPDGPDGMVLCIRHAYSRMGWQRCVEERTAEHCQGCQHLTQNFRPEPAAIPQALTIREWPYTRDCMRARHVPYAGRLRCRTCARHDRLGSAR
jgi:hypothetical protein